MDTEWIGTSLERIADALERLIELKSKPRQTRNPAPTTYDPHFIDAWKKYPKRNGSNSKAGAFKAWRARLKQSNDGMSEIALMLEGVKRYAAWCDETNKTNTEVVMQASRFFGPRGEYLETWAFPPPEVKAIRVPREGKELVKLAAKYGLEARVGELTWDFRQRVENHIAQLEI